MLMKNVLNNKPKCIESMGKDLFVTMPIYKETKDFSIVYINEKLYEKIFNKKYNYEEAKEDIKNSFSFTVYDNRTNSIGNAYIDKQKDPTGIALNENLGSGRAYYIGDNYNIKGEKTLLCTSSNEDYNNGKYPLEAAFQEAMISEVLSNIFDIDTFKVLAIIDKKEKYKFPKSKSPLSCGLIIRYYENNELYRFSHRFVNNKKFDYKEITTICKKMGIIEGNKIIHRFLHGAWSVGNISTDCNLIDFDTSFFVKGRQPSWIFSVAHKENYFGYEDYGEKRIIDILYDNKMISCNISKKELYKIIDTEKYNSITNGFLELISYDSNIYSKYKNMIDELITLFIKLYGKMVYNYDHMNCSNYFSEKNNIFDFSNFFRFYNIYKYYHKSDDLFDLLLNKEVELYQYNYINFEHYNAVHDFFKDDIIETPNDLDNIFENAKVFLEKFNNFNNIVDNDLKISLDSKIRKSYLINETKRYLMATTWLRGGLCNINDKYGPKLVNKIINFVTKYYTQKNADDFNSDLIIYEEGFFYRNIKGNSYSYVFEFYSDSNYKDISIIIDNNTSIELFKVNNYKYSSKFINNLDLKEISVIELTVDNKMLNLSMVDFKDNI